MEYKLEHLMPGQLGHLGVVLSFVAILLSAIGYFYATQRRNQPDAHSWRQIGRMGFILHGLATFLVIGSLFYILANKYYEYQYAWANVSDDLPQQYIFSAFWKEQQGSFLLWSFWNIILGLVILLRGGKWETPVLAVIALSEVFIASMILGLYFGDFRLGASPFDLLRDTMDAPIFKQEDYLTKIKGNGLNPLLQNYWMTIHPPTLFLGFASTVVPFAYAMAGLWLKEHREWLRPALKWSLFSGAILGLGILMGAAWAYEALSFGGYWAWDPVENTSLVPWLILVAGIHTNLVALSTGHSIRSTYAYYLLSFVLILYSTYLTRSGILGDTSAHAFTEMGLGIQLVLFIVVFKLLGLVTWIVRYKGVPDVTKTVTVGQDESGQPKTREVPVEEPFSSREFWMFIGGLALLFSGLLITGSTSLPVINKLFGTAWALKDPVEHHNRYQLGIAIAIGLLSGIAQFMRYNEKREFKGKVARQFMTHMGVAVVGAGILTWLNSLWIDFGGIQLYTLLFSAMFTVVSNLDYLIAVLRGNIKLAGSVVSHLGFGLLILGIMSTGLNKQWISTNAFAMEGLIEGADDDINKNVLLLKEAPMPIDAGWRATYQQDTIVRQTRTFSVLFEKLNNQGDPEGDNFVVHPNVMYDRQFTKVVASNPSTRHYWNYDIFTHVSSLPKAELDQEFAHKQDSSLQWEPYEATIGDTIFTKKHYIVVEGLTRTPSHEQYEAQAGDLAFGLKMRAYSLETPKGFQANPMLYLRIKEGGFNLPASVPQLQMKLRMNERSIEQIIKAEESLQYKSFPMKEGASVVFEGNTITFVKVDRNVDHPAYAAQEGDIAVCARLEIKTPDGKVYPAAPVYLIRDNRPFSLKVEVAETGLHLRFDKIDPESGTMTISAARNTDASQRIPIEIAENAARSDYIVLEAIIFPGINYVWAGSLLMLFGMLIGLWRRWKGTGA
ncbi:MAG: cytochrome c biogenesis protein CcsA [Chitinophagales bacterium]|nr:cytochrome c biogenesis protein CcsA [Chitinophagales bacterium]